jgi:hypothetical protein
VNRVANEEQVIFDATGIWPVHRRKIRNPLRRDRSPGAYFFYKNGKWRLIDHASPQHSGLDCWDIYCHIHNCTFKEAISKYDQNPTVVTNKRYELEDVEVRIVYDVCDWTEEGRKYWTEYGIDVDQLEVDGVCQVSFYKFNSRRSPDLWIEHYPTDPTFALNLMGRTKVYRPLAEDRVLKWTSDFQEGMYWYIRNSSEPSQSIFVGSSYKDIRCVANSCEMDCIAMAVSEGIRAEKLAGLPLMKMLKGYSEVVVGLDFDDAGHKAIREWERALKYHDIPFRGLYLEPFGRDKDYADLRKRNYSLFLDVLGQYGIS